MSVRLLYPLRMQIDNIFEKKHNKISKLQIRLADWGGRRVFVTIECVTVRLRHRPTRHSFISQENLPKSNAQTHSKITKTLTPTLEHRYFEDREDHTNALIQYSKALQIGKCRVDDEIVAMLRILHILFRAVKNMMIERKVTIMMCI